MRVYLVVLVLMFTGSKIYAQNQNTSFNINLYKYIKIKDRYEFQKEDNSFRINEMLAFYVAKQGLEPVMSSDKSPEDLIQNPCDGIDLELVDKSNFLRVKLQLIFTDCRKDTVYTGDVLTSMNKDYSKAYPELVRKAYAPVGMLGYSYSNDTQKSEMLSSPVEPKPDVVMVDSYEGIYKSGENTLSLSSIANSESYRVVFNQGEKIGKMDYFKGKGFQIQWDDAKKPSSVVLEKNRLILKTDFGQVVFDKTQNP